LTAATGFVARVAALCLLQLGALASLQAENLVSTRTSDIAPLAAVESISHILVVDGRPVAMSADSAWSLDENRHAWTRLDWHSAGQVVATAGDGRLAFVLLNSANADVRVAKLSLDARGLHLHELPPLPMSLMSAQGTVRDNTLYVAGHSTDGALQLLQIDLAADRPQWLAHETWHGSQSKLTSTVVQTSAVFVTLAEEAGQHDRMLRWKAGEGWSERSALPGNVVAGTARAIGQAHILYLVFAKSTGSAPQLLAFHTITGSTAVLGKSGAGARLGTGWGNGILWGRPATGNAGAEFGFVEIESNKPLLRWLDWIVIVVYLVTMLGMGLYFYLRQKRNSTSDFFVGGRTIPFWAAGVSLYAANTSSISYIAIPAKAFETNWQYLTNNLVAVLGLMFVAVWIVPLLRRLDLMSVFQYLETRFHPVIRTLASALFMAVQIGSRMSVILFLPSLAIATMTGIDVAWSIMIMGVFTIAYTAMGGMKAVIWTDVVQLIVKMGGIVFAIAIIVHMVDGGVGEMIRVAAAEDKTKLFDFSFDLTKATVWGFVFLVLFDVVLTFPKDQVLMQRVLSTRSDKDAGRSIWMFAAIMIPGGFMFYTVGTALYVFYKVHPERMNPLLTIDATFPLFIAAELPMGVKGLIIAGILAAAMATLSSIMNSVATLASVDFYEKLVKNPDPKVSVRFAEAMTVLTGLLGMGVALLLSRYDIHSLFDISIELAGLLGGGFAGAYTLGMFTRRANWQGVAIGVAASITLTTLAWLMSLVHPYFYLAISILTCIVVGYLASLLFPPPPQSLAGLTIYQERPEGQATRGPM
jgi:SSS family transporter